MPSEVFYCPYCEVPTRSKKNERPRYQAACDNYGKLTGEFRYLVRVCKDCQETFYVRQVSVENEGWVFNALASFSQFLAADDGQAGQSTRMQAYVGEYTKRIKRPLDVQLVEAQRKRPR